MSEQSLNHYYLLTGEVVFRQAQDEDVINSIRSNGVLATDVTNIGTAILGKAQQIIQLNFHNKMKDTSLEILDVIILNMTYLGYMTADEFAAPPVGTKLQEKTTETPSANDTGAPLPASKDALDNVVSMHKNKDE